MYIYHALINALSANMIHINLNVIFHTHVEHSPTITTFMCEIFYASEQTHHALVTLDSEWVTAALHSTFWISSKMVYLQRCSVGTWLVPCETAAISVHVLCTPYNHVLVYSVIRSHVRRVHACLAVTCHLHFWQTDLGSFTCFCGNSGWNRYWNKIQHRKMTLEKKILPPLLPGIEPMSLVKACVSRTETGFIFFSQLM